MGKFKVKKLIPQYKIQQITPRIVIPDYIKKFLDEYFEDYILNSTLKIHSEFQDSDKKLLNSDKKVKEMIEIETARDKEEWIDKLIIQTIQELNVPIKSQLIGEMKIYLAEKMEIHPKMMEMIRNESLTYNNNTENLDKSTRYNIVIIKSTVKPTVFNQMKSSDRMIKSENIVPNIPITKEEVKKYLNI
jgi:hypothetical protein